MTDTMFRCMGCLEAVEGPTGFYDHLKGCQTHPLAVDARRYRDERDAARVLADELAPRLRDALMLAGVSWDGDPWFAEQANITDPQGILDRGRDALAKWEASRAAGLEDVMT